MTHENDGYENDAHENGRDLLAPLSAPSPARLPANDEPPSLEPFSRKELENLKSGAPNYTARDIWRRVALTIERGYRDGIATNGTDRWLAEGEENRVRELQNSLALREQQRGEEHEAILDHHRLEIQRLRSIVQRLEDNAENGTNGRRDVVELAQRMREQDNRMNTIAGDIQIARDQLDKESRARIWREGEALETEEHQGRDLAIIAVLIVVVALIAAGTVAILTA